MTTTTNGQARTIGQSDAGPAEINSNKTQQLTSGTIQTGQSSFNYTPLAINYPQLKRSLEAGGSWIEFRWCGAPLVPGRHTGPKSTC